MRAEEITLSVPDGRRVAMLVNATPIRSADGAVESMVVTLQDLAPLEELERLRTEFLSMVSHELRAPLTSIVGSVTTLPRASPGLDPAEMRELHRIIDEQANHMRGLLADLLDQGRIETGTVSLAPEPAEVAGLVEQARRTFQGGGGTPALSVDLPNGLPRVMADPGRIAQVLNNLFSNAARHSPESSPIRVAAERDGVHVAISVSDDEDTSSFSIGDASVTEGGLGDGGPRVHGDGVAGGGHGDDGGLGDEHGAGRHGDGGHRLHRGQRHPQLREGGTPRRR